MRALRAANEQHVEAQLRHILEFPFSAFAAAVDHIGDLATGERFIVADDVPCTQQQFAERLAELCGATKPKSLPTFILKLILGKLLVETATMSCRVSNAKAKRVLG